MAARRRGGRAKKGRSERQNEVIPSLAGFRCPEKDGVEGGDLHGPLPCVVRVPRELSPLDAVSAGERDSRLEGRDGVSSRSTERLRS
jgi:hypothetical protein